MDKPSSSRPPQEVIPRRRLRLIPSTPRPEGAAIPPAQPGPPNMGVPQPPETFVANLYANLIRETIGRWNRARLMAGGGGESAGASSLSSSSESSSSLRFSDGADFDAIADEVIQGMQEEERERMSGGTQELGEPVVVIADEERLPHKVPSPRVEMEGSKELNDWKTHMENTVNRLLTENTAPKERVKLQEEQTHQLMGIVERMFAGREERAQASRQPLPACSSTSQNRPPRPNTEVHLAEGSRKRRQSTTPSQSNSEVKRTRKSGSQERRD